MVTEGHFSVLLELSHVLQHLMNTKLECSMKAKLPVIPFKLYFFWLILFLFLSNLYNKSKGNVMYVFLSYFPSCGTINIAVETWGTPRTKKYLYDNSSKPAWWHVPHISVWHTCILYCTGVTGSYQGNIMSHPHVVERVTLSMEKQKTRESNTRLVGVILMCVTTILIILVTLQIILHLAVLLYPAYMSIKVRSPVDQQSLCSIYPNYL